MPRVPCQAFCAPCPQHSFTGGGRHKRCWPQVPQGLMKFDRYVFDSLFPAGTEKASVQLLDSELAAAGSPGLGSVSASNPRRRTRSVRRWSPLPLACSTRLACAAQGSK